MRIPLKTVLVTTILMTVPTVVAGQSTLGFRGGLSLASFSGDPLEEVSNTLGSDFRMALSFGGFFNVPVSDVLGLQVGAGFVQKGADTGFLMFDESGLTEVAVNYMLSYIEIPLLLTLSPSSGNVGFNFFIGPVLGFNTGCTVSLSIRSVEQPAPPNCDSPESDVKSFDFGAMVGAGLDIGLTGNVSLVLDGFYNLGLTKIADSGLLDTKNRAFSILAGLSFSVGG